MADDIPDQPNPVVDTNTIALLLAEQNRLIRLLTERIGVLEHQGVARAPATALLVLPSNDALAVAGHPTEEPKSSSQPVPAAELRVDVAIIEAGLSETQVTSKTECTFDEQPAPMSTSLDQVNGGNTVKSETALPVTNLPTEPLRHEAPAFSPMIPPPHFMYPYGPYYPMHPFYPPAPWHPQTNHSPLAGSPQSSTPVNNSSQSQATKVAELSSVDKPPPIETNEWSEVPDNSWGEPVNDVAQVSSSTLLPAESNSGSTSAKKTKPKSICKFDDKCTRVECWFEHPSRAGLEVRSDAGLDSTYNPMSKTPANNQVNNSVLGVEEDPKKAKSTCRYGEKCTRKACWYNHPSGWSPPSQEAATSVYQADSNDRSASSTGNKEAPVDGGWGDASQDTETVEANNDWGVEPANDWSAPVDYDWSTPANNDWSTPANNDWSTPASNRATPRSAGRNNPPKASPSSQENVRPVKQRENERPPRRRGRKAESSTTSGPSVASSIRSSSVQPTPVASSERANAPIVSCEPPVALDSLGSIQSAPMAELVVDALDTPTLDSTNTPPMSSSSPEPDSHTTSFSWGDEPLDNTSSNGARTPNQQNQNSPDLDKFAPSAMYDSWAPTDSDWGFGEVGSTSNVGGAIAPANQTGQDKSANTTPSASTKGKRKATGRENPAPLPEIKNKDSPAPPINATRTSAASSVETTNHEAPSIVEPVSANHSLPQGVSDDEIPGWLIGEGEDSRAVLGLSPDPTPEPVVVAAPPPSIGSGPSPRRLDLIPGEQFPALRPTSNYQPPAISVASGPTIRPGRTGWKIISVSEAPTAPKVQPTVNQGSNRKSGQHSNKRYYTKKK